MKKLIYLSIFTGIITLGAVNSDIPMGIVTAFSSGNADQLAEYFGSTIELTMFEDEEVYSKTQAQIIIRNYFEKNPPISFQIIHKGGKESSQYAIGILKTNNSSYRITFLLKSNETSVYIHQLRIQNEN